MMEARAKLGVHGVRKRDLCVDLQSVVTRPYMQAPKLVA
jgi:hypothetical protein